MGGDSLSHVKGPGQEEGLALAAAAKQDRVQSLMVPLVTTTAFGETEFGHSRTVISPREAPTFAGCCDTRRDTPYYITLVINES